MYAFVVMSIAHMLLYCYKCAASLDLLLQPFGQQLVDLLQLVRHPATQVHTRVRHAHTHSSTNAMHTSY